MKVKMLSDRGIKGKSFKKGTVVDLPEKEARLFILTGKAEDASKKAEK